MLLKKNKITEEMVKMLSVWKHSAFHVFCGNRIYPSDDTAMENLARYIIRASFSQERMKHLDQEGTVVYTAKDRKTCKVYPAMEWLAATRDLQVMCSHIPNRGESRRWRECRTTDITATSHGENGRMQAAMMLSPASLFCGIIYWNNNWKN
jgi:hypothetical protein